MQGVRVQSAEGEGGGGGGAGRGQLSMPEGAGRCAAWAAEEVAAGLEKRRLACVVVVAVGVTASGACNMPKYCSCHSLAYVYCCTGTDNTVAWHMRTVALALTPL